MKEESLNKHRDGGLHVGRERLTEFETKAESQLVLLDLPVSIDVTVTHQGFPELVQVCTADAGLEEKIKKLVAAH